MDGLRMEFLVDEVLCRSGVRAKLGINMWESSGGKTLQVV